MKKILKIKLSLFAILLCLNVNAHGQNIYTGIISYTPDPSIPVPVSLPSFVYSLMTISGTYILTVDSLHIKEKLIVDDTEYRVGEIVTITGATRVKQGSFLEEYYELEIETIERSSLSQDIQRFLGTYECVYSRDGQSISPIQNKIIISEGRDVLLISLPGVCYNHYDPDMLIYLSLFVSGDSLFLPLQLSCSHSNVIQLATGKGKIENDSIFFNYVVHMLSIGDFSKFSLYTYTCKGKKSSSDIVLSPVVQNKVYYNAARQAIVINATLQNRSFTLELLDMQGKVILRETATSNSSISVANLPSGVYAYRLLDGNQIISSGKTVKL